MQVTQVIFIVICFEKHNNNQNIKEYISLFHNAVKNLQKVSLAKLTSLLMPCTLVYCPWDVCQCSVWLKLL